jgi:hypothetical protein
MAPGTGASRIAVAQNALNNSRIARQAGVTVGSVRTGLPGAGQLGKVLAPVGAVSSAVEFSGNVEQGDWQQAVGSGTAFVAGGLGTASLASPLIAGGLSSLPPVAGVVSAFSLGWTVGTPIGNWVDKSFEPGSGKTSEWYGRCLAAGMTGIAMSP